MKKPKVQRTREEGLKELLDQISLLQNDCISYDSGLEASGQRIAIGLRMLLHTSRNSHALLEQLDLRRGTYFRDTAAPRKPNAVGPYHPLVDVHIDGKQARYVPHLKTGVLLHMAWIPFDQWWKQPILVDLFKRPFSRGDLVLHVADTDGGAHVDPELDPAYRAISRQNSLAWESVIDGVSKGSPVGRPELACMRQIAHELLESLTQVTELRGYVNVPIPSFSWQDAFKDGPPDISNPPNFSLVRHVSVPEPDEPHDSAADAIRSELGDH